MTTTLIKGGTVVSSTGADPAEVLIDGEKIVAVLQPGSDIAIAAESGSKVIDATGRYVVPGGVDVHTHMSLEVAGTVSSDDFETGTRAAAWGGTTTIIDFAQQVTGQSVKQCLEDRMAEAAGECAIDYGLHMVIGGVDDQAMTDMDDLVNEGVSSFKLFMAYPGVVYSDDGQILRAMQQASGNGGLIMMHAENGIAIDVLAEQAFQRGETAPVNHGYVRRSELEAEATFRAIMLAKVGAAPLYIVHMSAKEALEQVAIARDKGANVFAETCPQYLRFNLEDHLDQSGFEGAKYVCSTPLRSKHEHHQDELWKGLRTNDLAVVSTDHCPFCVKEQKDRGLNDFRSIPNGIGGVEHRMDMIFQGVLQGEITLPRWVELCSTTPARMMGLYPRKGIIAPGADADIVIYDPTKKWTITNDNHHMNLDHNAYAGIEVTGHAETVMSRGRTLISNGQYHGSKGHGSYLKRSTCQYLI